MTSAAKSPYAGYRFPGEVISHAVWLYFRFPLSLRMVEEMLAARGIEVSHETVRQWARKFGQAFANQIRRRLPNPGDKWHLDEVCLMIRGTKHWLWRAVDQDGVVLDVLVQSRRDKKAAKRLLRKLLKRQMRPPRVMITDKLALPGVFARWRLSTSLWLTSARRPGDAWLRPSARASRPGGTFRRVRSASAATVRRAGAVSSAAPACGSPSLASPG